MLIKDLNTDYLDNVIGLQTVIYNYLDNKSLLETLSKEEFENVLSQGYAVGIIINNQLVAFRACLIPDSDNPEHLALDAKVAPQHSIYSEISLVHPEHRGNGYQTIMGEYLLKKLKNERVFNYVLATVAPDNLASLIDKFKLGFVIIKTKYKYQHKLRHILIKDLMNDMSAKEQELIYIPYRDIEWMLDNSNKYIGIGMRKHDIMYVRKH